MSKFTFVCQEEPMPFASTIDTKRTVEFNADSLDQILNEFEHFLRGCGFFFQGQLDFIDDEKYEHDDYDESEETNFNFDSIPKNNWPFGNLKPQDENVSDR